MQNPSGKILDMVINFSPLALLDLAHRSQKYFLETATLKNVFFRLFTKVKLVKLKKIDFEVQKLIFFQKILK